MNEDHKMISEQNHRRLEALEKQCAVIPTIEKQIADLHRKFLETTPTGEPPLVDRMSKAVVVFERSSWLGKIVVWAILGTGSLAAAGSGIITFLKRFSE